MFLSQAEVQEQKTAEQLQRRAAKMQAARQAAIKTLQQRREEKRQQAQHVPQVKFPWEDSYLAIIYFLYLSAFSSADKGTKCYEPPL